MPPYLQTAGLSYADFGAAVDGLEVDSASAASVDGKEVLPFVDWLVEDDFGKREVSSIVSTSKGLRVAWNIPLMADFRATALMLLRLSMSNFLSLRGQNDACQRPNGLRL